MKIQVYIDEKDENKTVELDTSSDVDNLLKELDINPVTVIVTKENKLVTVKEKLNDNDKLKILSVVSGG